MRHKAVFNQCKDVTKHHETRDHLEWTEGTGDPMHKVHTLHWTNTAMVKFEEDAEKKKFKKRGKKF